MIDFGYYGRNCGFYVRLAYFRVYAKVQYPILTCYMQIAVQMVQLISWDNPFTSWKCHMNVPRSEGHLLFYGESCSPEFSGTVVPICQEHFHIFLTLDQFTAFYFQARFTSLTVITVPKLFILQGCVTSCWYDVGC